MRANEIEERVRNLLLIIVDYITDRSRSQKQLSLNSSYRRPTSLLVDDTPS